jgi:hypothetical protein
MPINGCVFRDEIIDPKDVGLYYFEPSLAEQKEICSRFNASDVLIGFHDRSRLCGHDSIGAVFINLIFEDTTSVIYESIYLDSVIYSYKNQWVHLVGKQYIIDHDYTYHFESYDEEFDLRILKTGNFYSYCRTVTESIDSSSVINVPKRTDNSSDKKDNELERKN